MYRHIRKTDDPMKILTAGFIDTDHPVPAGFEVADGPLPPGGTLLADVSITRRITQLLKGKALETRSRFYLHKAALDLALDAGDQEAALGYLERLTGLQGEPETLRQEIMALLQTGGG